MIVQGRDPGFSDAPDTTRQANNDSVQYYLATLEAVATEERPRVGDYMRLQGHDMRVDTLVRPHVPDMGRSLDARCELVQLALLAATPTAFDYHALYESFYPDASFDEVGMDRASLRARRSAAATALQGLAGDLVHVPAADLDILDVFTAIKRTVRVVGESAEDDEPAASTLEATLLKQLISIRREAVSYGLRSRTISGKELRRNIRLAYGALTGTRSRLHYGAAVLIDGAQAISGQLFHRPAHKRSA